MKVNFPWPSRVPDGEQIWLSDLAMAFCTEELWERRGHEIESWDIEYAADQVRMFLWNVGLAGALQVAFEAGEQYEAQLHFREVPEWHPYDGRPCPWVAER